MNYGTLKKQWSAWSHRSDLTEAEYATIEHLVRNQIGEKLKSPINTGIVRLAGGDPLPDDWMGAQTVRDARGPLQYLPPDQYCADDGTYSLAGQTYQGTEADALYYQAPAPLFEEFDTNAVLDRFPDLYLFAGVAQVMMFIQDEKGLAMYQQRFFESIRQANAAANAQVAGPSAQMRFN